MRVTHHRALRASLTRIPTAKNTSMLLEKNNNNKTSLALRSACASRRALIMCDSRSARACVCVCVREIEGRDKRNARRVRRKATHHHPRQVDAPRPRSQSRKRCHDRRAWPGHSPGLGALPSVCSRGSPRRQPAGRWISDRATPPWSGLGGWGWWWGRDAHARPGWKNHPGYMPA